MADNSALGASASTAGESQQEQPGSSVSEAQEAPAEASILLSQCLLKLQAVRILSWYFDHLWGAA